MEYGTGRFRGGFPSVFFCVAALFLVLFLRYFTALIAPPRPSQGSLVGRWEWAAGEMVDIYRARRARVGMKKADRG
jgi:hypothetical protein